MSAYCLFGRPYFLYLNSVCRLKMDTIFVGWFLVMKCACDAVKVETVQIWTVLTSRTEIPDKSS